ncbi:MAG: PKD domain-containing protein, partial [Methylococcales bacterium]|nr:PKD domain-containing protein [Methylococcales bacterium]
MPNKQISPYRRKRRLGLIALAPIVTTLVFPIAQAAVSPITATAKYDVKIGKVVVAGKTATTILAGAKVSVLDASNNTILYTINTDKKNAFTMNLLGTTSVPCLVRVEVSNPKDNSVSQVLLPVNGADKSCSTVPACAITKPIGDTEITVGSSVAFEASKIKGDYLWSINDGSTDTTQAVVNHQFTAAGKYRVTLKVTDGENQCLDDVLVSVIPPKGTNPNGKVKEQSAPVLGGAMPIEKAGKVTNDTDALAVLPYEDMGMQGGSQISLPFNPMINYNALNAQVVQKVEHKPVLLDDTSVSVAYSAASNAKDPAGKDSINSTSQNLFDKNQVGTNYDTKASKIDPATGKPLKNVFIDGQDYQQAKIRKSEQWDRIHQPLAKEQGIDETGMAFADQQNRFMPAFAPALPDQGVRGNSDKAQGMRQMPGVANPYVKNDPQTFAYSPEKQNFAAQFIPASDIDDQGRTNPYPLMRVEAKVGGKTVAKTDAVYTTASETRCRECHSQGKIAGDEDVWRIPVSTDELLAPNGKPGAATGAGSFDPGADATKPWPPAVHNKFDDKVDDNPAFTNLAKEMNDPANKNYIPRDQNNLRTDRVKESRWVKVDATGKPTTETSPTKPATADGSWKLQVRLNFRAPEEEGGTSWVEQEKAALFNTLVMHDYMVYFGPTPATGKLWPASYSSQLADGYADDKGKSRTQPMYFCSGHHQSSLKFDVGVVPRAFQTNRSDYSKAFHAFHGKMQVYKADVSAAVSADGLAHKKGDLIRDERGHPKMLGGRGWDSQHDDDNGVPLTADANGDLTVKTVQPYDATKNNWRPDLFPADKNGEPMVKVGEKVPVEENCNKCHTGATEKSYRDIHHTAGLKCDSCHGDMLAVGNVYPNKGYDANLTGGGAYTGDSVNFRRPWLDEPNCGSC